MSRIQKKTAPPSKTTSFSVSTSLTKPTWETFQDLLFSNSEVAQFSKPPSILSNNSIITLNGGAPTTIEAEPNPNHFETFADYEAAMVQWTDSLKPLALAHPKVLKSLLHLSVNNQTQRLHIKQSDTNRKDKSFRLIIPLISQNSSIPFYQFRHTSNSVFSVNLPKIPIYPIAPQLSFYSVTEPLEPRDLLTSVHEFYENLSLSLQTHSTNETETIVVSKAPADASIFQSLSEKIKKVRTLDVPNHLGKIFVAHQTRNSILPRQNAAQVQTTTNSKKSLLTSSTLNIALERTDLTASQLQTRLSSPLTSTTVQVHPPFEMGSLYNPQDIIPEPLFAFASSSSTKERYKNSINKLFWQTKYDKYYSWGNPSIPSNHYDSAISQAIEIISEMSGTLYVRDLKALISCNLPLDQFEMVFQDNSYSGDTILEHTAQLMNIKNFRTVLDILDLIKVPFKIARLAYFALVMLTGPQAASVISTLVTSQDIVRLSALARLSSFFDPIPKQHYFHDLSITQLVSGIFGKKYNNLSCALFVQYFLEIISFNLDEFARSPLQSTVVFDSSVSKSLKDSNNQISAALNSLFSGYVGVIETEIFQGISHRNRSVSMFFVFMLYRLLDSSHRSIRKQIPEEEHFFDKLFDLCFHKFSHVRNAIHKVFYDMFNIRDWTYWIFKKLNQSHLERLFGLDPSPDANPSWKPIRSTFTLHSQNVLPTSGFQAASIGHVLLRSLQYQKATTAAVAKLLNVGLFTKVFQAISNHNLASISSNISSSDYPEYISYHHSVVNIPVIGKKTNNLFPNYSSLISLSTTFYELTKLHMSKTSSSRLTSAECPQLVKSLSKIIARVQDPSYQSQTLLLKSLNTILNLPDFVDQLVSSSFDFFQYLDHWIRIDDIECREFNQAAWDIVFSIYIKAPQFIKNILKFLEYIMPGSGRLVMTNGLNTISKILLSRPQNPDNSIGLKNWDSFASHLKRHFINLHSCFKNLEPESSESGYPGESWLAIATVYDILLRVPFCKKIIHEALKNNEDYRNGLQTVQDMFDGFNDRYPQFAKQSKLANLTSKATSPSSPSSGSSGSSSRFLPKSKTSKIGSKNVKSSKKLNFSRFARKFTKNSS